MGIKDIFEEKSYSPINGGEYFISANDGGVGNGVTNDGGWLFAPVSAGPVDPLSLKSQHQNLKVLR